jgi:hypothetical protein
VAEIVPAPAPHDVGQMCPDRARRDP